VTTIKYHSNRTSEFPTLAEASWQVFSRYLSRYQWAFDDPQNSYRSTEIASAIQNWGKKGCCTFYREEGYKVVLKNLNDWAFTQAVQRKRRIYYVSSGKHALLYFDIDLHHIWQTREEGEKAARLLDKLFTRLCGQPALFWSDSGRGLNGYLKVDLPGKDYASANVLFARLEHALQQVLAFRGNVADFEIKGRIGYMRGGEYQWAQYGKLPIHHPDWNFPRLKEFEAKPSVPLRRLHALCRKIEKHIPADVLEQHKAHKKSLGDEPITRDGFFLVTPAIEKALTDKHGENWHFLFSLVCRDRDGCIWLGRRYYRPGATPMTEHELSKEKEHEYERNPGQTVRAGDADRRPLRDSEGERTASESGPVTAVPGKRDNAHIQRGHRIDRPGRNVIVLDLASDPDSFRRQKAALMRLARTLKRVPTVEEGLEFLRDERLFTGPWEQHLTRRKARVRAILRYITRTFDASKCARGSVNVGKYNGWVAVHFPWGLAGRRRKDLTPEGEVVERGNVTRVRPIFLATFLAICEFALVLSKNKDQSLPTRRAKQLWDALYAKGLVKERFSGRKWAVCREAMVRHGVIRITDRSYGPGHAMRWDVGPYFPYLGLWKAVRRERSRVQVPRTCQDTKHSRQRGERTGRKRYNTWLYKHPLKGACVASCRLPRPPPTANCLAQH
jgi:hypothetical protein